VIDKSSELKERNKTQNEVTEEAQSYKSTGDSVIDELSGAQKQAKEEAIDVAQFHKSARNMEAALPYKLCAKNEATEADKSYSIVRDFDIGSIKQPNELSDAQEQAKKEAMGAAQSFKLADVLFVEDNSNELKKLHKAETLVNRQSQGAVKAHKNTRGESIIYKSEDHMEAAQPYQIKADSVIHKSKELQEWSDSQGQAKKEDTKAAQSYKRVGDSAIDKLNELSGTQNNSILKTIKELKELSDAQKRTKMEATEAAQSYKSAGDSATNKIKELKKRRDAQKKTR
jgi:hypothetical protein